MIKKLIFSITRNSSSCFSTSSIAMACFMCNESGHWSRNCPKAVCRFCGMTGHSTTACTVMHSVKNTGPTIQEETMTRSRQRKVIAKTFDEILFDHHVLPKPSMKADIVTYIKLKHTKQGMVDADALAEDVFGDTTINPLDAGHQKVATYIIGKYCEVSNEHVKTFLRSASDAIDVRDITSKFNVIPMVKNGVLHFRKRTGGMA